MIRVAFISRATLFSSAGGDTVQMTKTAEWLRKQDVEVDVLLCNEVIDYSKYHLLHFFNIIRPADILIHIRRAKSKPFVVSPIYVDYGQVSSALSVFSKAQAEYIKTIARYLKNGEKIASKEYLFRGHTASIKYILHEAAMLLPNSESEYHRLSRDMGLSIRYHVIPNGIDASIALKNYPESEKYKDAILCMGRIEPRKNQLNLIRALNNTNYQLYIHGKPSPNHQKYYAQCKAEAAPNVYIEHWLEEDELYTAYSNAKVHVLASYFETTGLSSLEAAVMGCNIVVTDKGDTRDYFQDRAWYCEPANVASIKKAIDEASMAIYNEDFKNYILANYTWEKAAAETLKVYQQVLSA